MPGKPDKNENRWSWNLPDKFDRIRAHVMEGTKLDAPTQKFYERAQQIFQWLCEGKTEKEVVNEIVLAGWGKSPTARKLIRGTKRLFNTEPGEAFKNTERAILIEMAKETYQLAKKDQDRRSMIAAIKELRTLMDLDRQDGGLEELYAQIQLPQVIYTTDPNALYEEAEEAGTFEEIPNKKAISAPEGVGSAGQ